MSDQSQNDIIQGSFYQGDDNAHKLQIMYDRNRIYYLDVIEVMYLMYMMLPL